MAEVYVPTDTEAAIADLYEMVELRMLKQLSDKLKAGGSAPDWQTKKLLELELLKQQMQGQMASTTADAIGKLGNVLKQGYEQGWSDLDTLFDIYGETKLQVQKKPVVANPAMAALFKETSDAIGSVHHTVLRAAEDAYREAVASVGAPGMLAGADTRATAIQATLNRLADKGITGFTDKAGRKWEMRAYVEMATGTAVHRANTEGTLGRLLDSGHHLVVVSDHGGECPDCRKWEGKVLSIDGAFLPWAAGTVSEARSAGLEHPGCRHRYTVWIPGVSKKPPAQGKPADYDLRTQQRAMERQVRAWKRRAAVGDPKAPAYVKKWQSALNDHVKTHGLKRRYDREQNLVGKAGALPKPPAPKPKLTPPPAPAPTTPPAPKVAHLAGSAPVKQLRDEVKVLSDKLSKVNPTSPWGKKYTADLAQKKALLDKIDTLEDKLSKVSPTGPWGKKYLKDLDALEQQLKDGTVKVPTPPAAKPEVKPVNIPKPVNKPTDWKGKPEPKKPTLTEPVKPPGPGKVVFDPWIAEAKKRFSDFAAKTGNPKNDLTKSLNWNYFVNVTEKNDKGALQYLLQGKYIDQKMYDDALQLMVKADTPLGAELSRYNAALAAFKAEKEQWALDIKAWRAANGIPEPKLGGMDAALRHYDDHVGTQWANDNLETATGSAKDALQHYTGGSYASWNNALRAAAAEKRPISSRFATLTQDADTGFIPLKESLIVNRGTDMGEFVVNGVRSMDSDPLKLVGTIQRAEGYTSTSVGTTSAFGGQVKFRIRVPKDYPTAWVAPYSKSKGERELIIARGSNFYIHAVYKDSEGKWVVEAEVLPADVDPTTLSLADILPSSKPF